MGIRAVSHDTPRLETANRDPPWIEEIYPKRRVFMESPMDITQFNALLHSKKDQTQLMSSLSSLTKISDLDVFIKVMNLGEGWWHW
jgi:hypothetical protein